VCAQTNNTTRRNKFDFSKRRERREEKCPCLVGFVISFFTPLLKVVVQSSDDEDDNGGTFVSK